ncbi:inositol monophosphatase family protein [Kitasatospora sp. NPDC056138]|uniref:inositol monophosphatase family protein n=1 Tax=Kitasatospora sp. NPDC056138 TaxID=3345724 RepID=UPI0035E2C954
MNRLEVARAASAAGAAAALRCHRDPDTAQWWKSDGSIVTDADLAAEEAVIATLRLLAPDDAIIAEERGGPDALSDVWIIDPIDGTENFSRGHPVWATLVAWSGSNGESVAAIDAPALGRSWWAERGRGAHSDLGPLYVSGINEAAAGGLCFGGVHEYPLELRAGIGEVAAQFRTAWGWGNFWAHILVAEGVSDAAVSYGTSLWDVVAPALVVAEAGGTSTDVLGNTDPLAGSLVSTNGRIHGEVISALAAVGFSAPSHPGARG